MIELFAWTSAALGALSALFVLVLVLRRLTLARNSRLRREAEARLRPVALELVEGESAGVQRLGEREGQVLAGLLSRYARWLSGDARENIAVYFERSGSVARELDALESRRTWRRATAAYVLGDMASPSTIPGLIAALGDPEREVRSAAARSLGRLGAVEAVEALLLALVRDAVPRAVAGAALLTIGPPALPELERLVDHPEAEARYFAVELIGLLGNASHAPLLIDRLRDTSAEVRAKATRALGRVGAEEAADELRAALGDRIPFVRATAAHALAMIGDRGAVLPLVLQARGDSFFDAAQAAARAVGQIDAPSLARAADAPCAGPHLREAAEVLRARAS